MQTLVSSQTRLFSKICADKTLILPFVTHVFVIFHYIKWSLSYHTVSSKHTYRLLIQISKSQVSLRVVFFLFGCCFFVFLFLFFFPDWIFFFLRKNDMSTEHFKTYSISAMPFSYSVFIYLTMFLVNNLIDSHKSLFFVVFQVSS